GRATYWGTRDKGRASDVAFANGISAHAFELDDYHPVKVHPGAVVIPAALAVAEETNASAQDVLAAIAVGYEVMIRTSAALDPSVGRLRGWHLTGVTGTFGAAAAAGRLLGLDAERMSWAFGLAGTQSSGLFAFNADGAMSKRFHAGHAARGGVVAAEMAQLGFTGPTSIYETEDGGFLRAFSDASSPEPLVHALGEDWRLFDIAFKPYSCCGSLHAYIDAARALRDEFGFADGSEQRVRIGLPKVVEVQCGFDYEEPTSLGAQMNARFCVASALRYGNVLPAQFETERLADPETLRIMDRVEQVHDASLDDIYPAQFCAWVELQDADGSYRREYRAEPSGWASNPERSDVLRAKFSSLMSDRLASATQQALTDWVEEVTVRPVARANSTLRVAELVGLLDVGERVPGDERTGQG
ncbi:MAG: MmgE/PrpD family protein, partial [Gammaproteobacteria bacterium]|nr:MmgE/PrpD family protein [Gammaproteobacteria bacterium]